MGLTYTLSRAYEKQSIECIFICLHFEKTLGQNFPTDVSILICHLSKIHLDNYSMVF